MNQPVQDNKVEKEKDFTNPYLSAESTQQISAEFDSNDYNLIKSIRPKQGTVTTTMSLLWKQLCYELRQRNITNWETDCKSFLEFMRGFRIISEDEFDRYQELRAIHAGVAGGGLQHSPVGRTDGETGASNDGERTSSVRGVEQSLPPKPSNVQKRSGKAGKGKETGEGKSAESH